MARLLARRRASARVDERRATTSCSARRAGFGEPSTFGTQPSSNWRARAAATVTNSNEFFGFGRRPSVCQSWSPPLVVRNVVDDRLDAVGRRRARRARSAITMAHNLAHAPVELVVDRRRSRTRRPRRPRARAVVEPPLRSPPRVLAAAAQPLLEHPNDGGSTKIADRVRHPLLAPAARPARRSPARRRARPPAAPRSRRAPGAVEVAEDVGPLEELVRGATIASNAAPADKIIVDAVLLAGPAGRDV